jgi:hypothetical protein
MRSTSGRLVLMCAPSFKFRVAEGIAGLTINPTNRRVL